ncbi:MAG: hypothetical protein ACFWTL_06220 [Atopobium sp.]
MITVFTPTYNRAYTLTRLFNSMQIQGCRDFEWVVVDDGSTDDTETLCQSFLSMATFPMRYIRQGNAGKHVAINRGATEAEGEWFFIVDSDDWLPKDSIELNVRYISQIADDPSFAGVSGVRARADGSLLLGPGKSLETMGERTKELFAREYIDATSQDYRDKFRMPGDRAEVIRTELVRETPFPSFPGERFVDEYYLWQSLSDRDLKLRWFNKATYCGDYLADGLTTNMRDVMRRNPLEDLTLTISPWVPMHDFPGKFVQRLTTRGTAATVGWACFSSPPRRGVPCCSSSDFLLRSLNRLAVFPMTVRMLTSERLMDTRIFTAKNLLTILLVSSVLFFTLYMRLNLCVAAAVLRGGTR